VMRCDACRRDYDAVAAALEDVLPGVPAVEPPIGFDEQVLARLAADGRSADPRTPRRRMLVVAAAILVALLVPVGVWLGARGDDGTAVAGAVATLRSTRGDSAVGTVSIADLDGRRVMVVALVDAPDDVAYYCRTRFADGTTVDSASWPAGNGAWLVPLPSADGVVGVEVLPAGTEQVWSRATFS
jgi:hypothetical protein